MTNLEPADGEQGEKPAATATEPQAAPAAAPTAAPFPQPSLRAPAAKGTVFRPVVLFGFAAILVGCAAILWVILHFATGATNSAGTSADAAARAAGHDFSVSHRTDKEVVTGSWGVPWGGPGPGTSDASANAGMDTSILPSRGADEPLLALVEFGDYECEFTQKAERTVEKLLSRFNDEVRLVFVHDPLAIHDHALLAAQAAEAARMQGRFGEMHEKLLAAKGNVDRAAVVRLARDLGLDTARFERDLDGPAKDRVASMVAFAKARGLTGTPHFVIGGRVIEGARSEEIFVRVIEAALEEAKARVGVLHSRDEVYRDSLSFLQGG
ncbi:MAG: DsbA family protein [Deltaproteobacteria bacterium]|nr:DsbA family protein [Deltaproteobacteria bacterium]